MDVTTAIKNEPATVKVEEPADHEVIILQNVDMDYQEEVEPQLIDSEEIPHILHAFKGSANEEHVQIVQLDDGQYTYIIENTNGLEEGGQFQLANGEHYIIEEYQEECEEDEEEEEEEEETDQNQYETLYIQPESPCQEVLEEQVEEHVLEMEVAEDNLDEDQEDPMELIEEEPPKEGQSELQTTIKKEIVYIKQPADEVEEPQEKPASKSDIELIFECSMCSRTFKTSSGVKRHITVCHSVPTDEESVEDILGFSLCPCCGEPSDSAHTVGDFACDLCGQLFIQQKALERHKSINHPVDGKYECCECKNEFATRALLIEHSKYHSLKSVKCDDCGREFSRKYHLERHISQTGCMGVPKQLYECRVCLKTFTRKDNLAEHLKGHAGIATKKPKTYTCDFCMKEFTGLALLQIHVRTHTGERPFGCDVCDKKFPSSGALKKHFRKHTGEKPYTCPECKKRFAAKETLNRHWRTHTGEKPHQCKYCGKSFIQPAQLRAHIFHHTGENAYTCPHCNRAFNRKLRLTTHIKFMHDGAQRLPCPNGACTKTFFRKEDIQRHMRIHSDDKPFKCDICDKSFTIKSSLQIHRNVHKKEMPVACEVCNRSFIRKDCLMRHMRSKHRNELEDIVANAEKKRLQKQLLRAVANATYEDTLKDTTVWNELTLTESIKELLSLLVDEECLTEIGHPEAPVDKVLEAVIRKCGHSPAQVTDYDYITILRENAKLLFTVVIDDNAVKELLNNQTVDEVILHVLKLARKQALEEESEEIEIKPIIRPVMVEEDDCEEEEEEEAVDNPEDVNKEEDDEDENSLEYVIEEGEDESASD